MTDHKNLIESFLALAAKTPNKRFMTQPVNGATDEMLYWTYGEALSEAQRMACYLDGLELEAGSRIALCSKNCAWWILADLAIWMSGHVTVPVYPTLTGDTVAYILEHSESQLLFIGKLDEKPWEEMKKGVPDSLLTVNFPMSPGGAKETWKDLVGKFSPIEKVADRAPEEMATIIYTSGSTGMPKGVMQSFSTMMATTKGIADILKMNDKDRYLSYLPLAHGMERWLAECVSLYTGMELFFAEALTTFVHDLNRAKPTLFMSVPRLWTKFQQGVFKKMPPQKLDLLLKIPLINILVRKKIVKTLGLDSCRLAGSGSAPMPAELIGWYRQLGIELLEGYGLTETFNYCHLSLPGKTRVGYVGNPYPDVDVRIADDGEIQLKTPGQMMGYYKNPDATKETMTADGFFRTGDRGEIDSEGRLKITGRTKEIFKTSKGKYVAPAPIESALISHPRVELACVGGSSYPQPHAILQLSEDSRASGDQDEIGKELEAHIKVVNAKVDPHEHLEFVVVVKDEWLPENGFLTPTQKIVRRKIEESYAPNNDEWYSSKKKVIWHGW